MKVGFLDIHTWPDLLGAPFVLQKEIKKANRIPEWARLAREDEEEKAYHVRVEFKRGEITFSGWCLLGRLPIREMVPSVLWFFLKMILFLVGALVFWNRPSDNAVRQFFLLCVVTVGAFMGGYHWSHIATQPVLVLIFMTCAVMLPPVSLHFYLIFPRKKSLVENHPRMAFLMVYGVPLFFLAALVGIYVNLRWLVQSRQSPDIIEVGLDWLRTVSYFYLGIAALWYVASVGSLLHSYASASDHTERNQVKWIFLGAFLALIPIGYSFYLAVWDPAAFSLGGATWPMFGASACLTAAFAISITRYRLLELDKIISSGMGYFLVSFLAALVYFGVVFIGALVFSNQVIPGPKLVEALTVSTTALVLMLTLDLARSRFRKALDRRFSRDKSQLDRTLQQLGQAIEQLVDPLALAQKLLQTSTEVLGADRGCVYLRHGDPPLYQLAGAVGQTPPLNELSCGCPLIESLEQGRIVTVPWNSLGLDSGQRQLHFLGGEIAHPLIHEGRLLAFLILGPRGLLYRSEDLDLLAAFAQITVLALKSAEGHRTIELLNRDLQAKVEKISEQQRRILALQSQLRRLSLVETGSPNPDQVPDPGEQGNGQLVSETGPGGIVGSSIAVSQLLHLVRKVAPTDAVVLIRGESGTGKELLARAVHETSSRAAKPFVKVHCAALSANLLESELFGHVKGAFTGAHRDKIGRFEMANGGTLFLDEIGDINLEVQTKLLRVLQEKTLERVGSSEPINVDVRIIAATHQDLESLIRHGRFREDLYYRLNVFPVQVPSLRERVEDIPELAMHFMRLYAQRCKKEVNQIDDDLLAALKGHGWPGNIRQLENVIERAVVIAEGSSLTLRELPEDISFSDSSLVHDPSPHPVLFPGPPLSPNGSLKEKRLERERLERDQLVRALAAAGGNKAEAARSLGIARSTLVSRLKKFGFS